MFFGYSEPLDTIFEDLVCLLLDILFKSILIVYDRWSISFAVLNIEPQVVGKEQFSDIASRSDFGKLKLSTLVVNFSGDLVF